MHNRLQFWQSDAALVREGDQQQRLIEAIIAHSPTLQNEGKFRNYLTTLGVAALQERLAQMRAEGQITPTSTIRREHRTLTGML